MPAKTKISREEIINYAFGAVKTGEELNARKIAAALNVSTQPIFSNFRNMEELKKAVAEKATALFEAFISSEVKKGGMPAYKLAGIGYIKFAATHKHLFNLLFLEGAADEKITEAKGCFGEVLTALQRATGFDEETCYDLYISDWIFVHGIATMIAGGYLDWDGEVVSAMLTVDHNGKVGYIKKLKGIK